MRSDINKDVATLLDKYSISDIMDKIIEYSSDESNVVLTQWCAENLGTQTDVIGDGIDDHAIRALRFELDRLNARIANVEQRIPVYDQCSQLVNKL